MVGLRMDHNPCWNDFEVYMKYRFGLGWKSALKMGENTHSGHFSETCTGTI